MSPSDQSQCSELPNGTSIAFINHLKEKDVYSQMEVVEHPGSGAWKPG